MGSFREILETPSRLFALGDVHGCADELRAILDHLRGPCGFGPDDLLIAIGDYIDRGKASRVVIDQLLEFKQAFPRTIFLRGNHEDMLLGFLGFGGHQGQVYLANGGITTLREYEVRDMHDPQHVVEQIPELHLEFFRGLERYVAVGRFVFAHAGLNPLRGLASQVDEDLFWIRDEFINNIHHFDRTVVFGHTPYEDVLLHLPFKIGIDTGAVYGNMLTCFELMQGVAYQVRAGKAQVEERRFPLNGHQ